MIKKILGIAQTTSAEFGHPGGLAFILMDRHAGETWTLQVQTPEGRWVDLSGVGGVEFDENGMQVFYGTGALSYRLTGGTVGAEAWVVSNEYAPGVKTFE